MELPAKPEAKPARLIDHEDPVAFGEQRLHPRHELLRPEAPRRFGRGVVFLRRDDAAGRVNVETGLIVVSEKLRSVSAAPVGVAPMR